jgi:peptidoglycan/xylan/chitin deacetylase (PgdA/CDA1 family)
VAATSIRSDVDRRSLVKDLAGALDRVRRPHAGIVVLIYHRVGADRGGQMNLAVSEFDCQVGWLAAHRRVLSLDQAADELSTGGPVEPGVVITFDDGTPDWAEGAIDVLARHQVPATMYVATRFVEEGAALPDGCPPISWQGLADVVATGLVSIGSHTHSHVLLDRTDASAAIDELDRSRGLIQDRLGVAATHFAYPKALPATGATEAAVRERFRTATLAGTRANRAGADLHRLARSPIQSSDLARHFEAKVDGGLALEDDVRTLANRVRQRSATV